MVAKISVYEQLAGNTPTTAQATALGGHTYTNLKQDQLTKNVIGANGNLYPSPMSNNPIGALKVHGSFEDATGVLGYTLHTVLVSPVPFYGLRIKMFNMTTVACVNVVAGVASCADISASILGNSSAPLQVTVGGATSWTLPAASANGNTVNAVWSETFSDWMPCVSIPRTDGGPGYLICIRLQTPSAGNTNANRCGGMASLAADVNNFGAGGTCASGDFTFANWGSMTASVNGLGCPVGVELLTAQASQTVAIFGDSTFCGADGTFSNGGAAVQAYMSMLKTSNFAGPWMLWNQGEASMNSQTYLQLCKNFCQYDVKPNVMVYCGFSPNDVDRFTVSGTNRQIAGIMQFLHEARKKGSQPILVTPCPVGGGAAGQNLTTAQEAFRVQVVNATKSIGTAFGIDVIDRDALYTNYSSGGIGGFIQSPVVLGGNISYVHPSVAGYAQELFCGRMS